MIVLVLSIIVGIALLTGLLYWATQSLAWTGSRQLQASPAEAEAAIKLLGVNLPRQDLVARIFSEEDYQFVSEFGPPEFLQEFLENRKRIALLWLQQVRVSVRMLMDFYRKVARTNPALVPSTEARILLHYLGFKLACWFLTVMIRFQGPFSAKRTSRMIRESVETVSLEVGSLLLSLDEEQFARIHSSEIG